jgi:FG-GAP-like repeat/Abnormal spindle-like microcephaly-assoc'd, ASPM-SPD-2-Hydin
MKRARFVCLFVLFAITTVLAQTNPVPLVNQPLVPTTAAPGGPAFILTVNGTGFVSGAVVNWNGNALATTFVSASQLTATVPASNIAVAATAAITVTNPTPGGGSSNPVFFPVSVPANSVYFTNSQILTTGSSPSCIAVGDFDRDGKLDLAVANNGSGTVSIFLGNGDGTFQSKVDYPTIASPTGVTVADLRGNGMFDLAVASFGEISILLGNGDGTFQTHVDYPGYSCGGGSCEPVGGTIVAADFNGDGKLDLATSYGDVVAGDSHKVRPPILISGGFTSVFLGNGDGTFQSYINTSSDPAGGSLAAGDFNNDGKIDLASSLNPSLGDDTLTAVVALGSGNGIFSTSYEQDVGLWDLVTPAVAAADLNGDGNLDFVACSGGGAAAMLGNGDGTFQVTIAPGAACPTMVFGDFHGNGFLDLATVYWVLAGNGTGVFSYSAEGLLPGGKNPVWVAVADFNGDGKLDAVIADGGGANAILVDLQSGNAVLSPTSLSLSSYIGITSAPQTVTLSNTSGVALAISNISVSTGFAQTSNCPLGRSLAPKSSCTIQVTFTPTSSNTVSGTLSATDDGPGSPQAVALTGTVSAVTLTPNSLSFVSYIGTTSAPQSVTLSNTASEALAISAITASADFAETNNCPVGGSLPSGSSCIIKVTFTPTASGTVSGTVSITDDGLGSPQMMGLTGAVQDFAIATTSQTSVTVTPGQAANYSISVSPVNGFNQTVQLSCSGAPAQATCTVSPTSVTLDGSKDVAGNIAVVTTAATMALTKPYGDPPVTSRLERWSAASGWLALILATSLVGWLKRSPRWICGPAFLCLMALGFAITGCGGSSNNGGGTGGTPSGSYTLTVTGTFSSGSSNLTHKTNLTLVVQ